MKNKLISKKEYKLLKEKKITLTKEELENCICCEYDGKGVSCCGFPCLVHSKQLKEKKIKN